MSQEVLIPKMKRLDKTKRRVKIPILNFAIIAFCSLLITLATFVNLDIKHFIIPANLFSLQNPTMEDFIFSFRLIPQIPIVMFVCALLGRRMAATSVVLYILAGLFIVPVFGLGGGVKYVFEYGFGYILAYIPAVILSGKLLKKYTFADMIRATIAGVLIIHIIGLIYMMILAGFKHAGTEFITGWFHTQSGLKIIYDLISSFVLVLIGKYLHEGVKFILE